MSRQTIPFSKTVFLLATVAGLIWASAGDLDPPPGEIRPTMKSLTEVEPRSALSPQDLPTTISAPGSYYLAGDYTETSGRTAIHITAGGVTLDLNGYTLYGNQVGTIAINVATGVANTTIRNGHIRNWQVAGIDGEEAEGVHVEGVHVDTVGGGGFTLGGGSVVSECSARRCATGFEVTECTVTRCIARNNTSMGFGIAGGTVTECTATYNGVRGFQVGTATVARNCTARHNDIGFSLNARGVIADCIAADNTGAGIRATGSDNRIEGNDVTNNGVGLDLDGAGNFVAGNLVKGNTDNYNLVSGNQLNILLCEIPESIDWPAQVTLAGSLTGVANENGISVTASDVTIDLAGHTLFGVPNSLRGIEVIDDSTNISIRNGGVRGWGSHGIYAQNVFGGSLADIHAYENQSLGISAGYAFRISDCILRGNSGGIYANRPGVFTNCIAYENSSEGFTGGSGHVFDGCSAFSNGGFGFASLKGTVTNCSAGFNGNTGIYVWEALIRGNRSTSNGGQQIYDDGNSTIIENHAP